ncbi:Coenzyme Q-binding protein coq10a, mitochondrial [Podila verticillata]|nr:Coenzyme Q-binding protein coq10a, mitochondrial [Podila verticillata]
MASWPLSSVRTTRVNQSRTFIGIPSLPKLPNILNPLANIKTTKHYKDRKLLKYSQQEFYDLVANVDDYQNFLPWCTYSKMSDPLPSFASAISGSEHNKDRSEAGEITVRHGELGIGFNSFQERYVSKVTCQAPWTVTAVSYDSKLFKELSTTWKFTPNVPKSTTLEAGLDQEVQERKLLTKSPSDLEQVSDEDKEKVPSTTTTTTTSEPVTKSSQSDQTVSSPELTSPPPPPPPRHFFTAAAVFGASALPYPTSNYETASPPNPQSPRNSLEVNSTTTPSKQVPFPSQALKSTPNMPLPPPVRTASPSNLGTMKPSDYPSVWVDFEIAFEFESPVHASVSSMFFDQVSKEMLAAFIQRAQVLYGKR